MTCSKKNIFVFAGGYGPFLGAALALVLAVSACGGSTPDGDAVGAGAANATLLYGPRFATGDPERPWVDGLLVKDGRVIDRLDRRRFGEVLGDGGTLQQLPGEIAVPGLVDAHAHLFGFGSRLHRVELVGTENVDEVQDAVRRYAGKNDGTGWILGRGWDQNDWPDAAWPDADMLEDATGGRPAALWRIDGHAVWLNRTALAAAGIDSTTRDPPGGRIVRDGAGRPTGILIDNAMALVDEAIPQPHALEVASIVADAVRELARLGLTGIHDMGLTAPVWRALLELDAKGELPIRVTGYAVADGALRASLAETGPQASGRLRLVGVKLYADGALGSRGARLVEPYSDAPETQGLWVTPPPRLEDEIRRLLENGLQPAVHAIGDAAIHELLDIFERLLGSDPRFEALRPRIEHVQIVNLEDVGRFAELGIVASMQPTHATSDMPWAATRVGPSRIEGAYAWRTLLRAGAALAFGSDAPVESADPRLGLHAAVTRQDLSGEPPGGWRAEETIEIERALAAFSAGAAFAERREDELGRIEDDFLCDLTLFGADVTRVPAHRLPQIGIVGTVIGGDLVLTGDPEPEAQ